jgi:putative endonuclease
MSVKTGYAAEQQALMHLTAQGLTWLTSNYRCRWGEIDLIMQEDDYLVFVEVRARSSLLFGGAAASVTYSKQQKLLKAAAHYLLTNKINEKQPTRFDLLSLEGKPTKVEWIKNVFGLNF